MPGGRSAYSDASVTDLARLPPPTGNYTETAASFVKQSFPEYDFRMLGGHYIGKNGVGHVQFRQSVNGVDLDNGNLNINIGRDGRVFSHGGSVFRGKVPSDVTLQRADYEPADALRSVVRLLDLAVEAPRNLQAEPIGTAANKFTITGTTGADRDPVASLVYLNSGKGQLHLVWKVETVISFHWLVTYIDAVTDRIHVVIDNSHRASYKVYPLGVNDPEDGDRIVVEDPWLLSASPFTWTSDGYTNYTTTEGNNVVSLHDYTGNGFVAENCYRTDSPDLIFQYPYSACTLNPADYLDASITQLFYTANIYHDLLYQLGFNEEAGNFQANNNGRGGLGNDKIIISAQDSWFMNNAVYFDAPDGESPFILMLLWDLATTVVRDCAFDTGVALHEYTHGLSLRLTGGPQNFGCLSTLEAGGMGEGWSDFMPTVIRLKENDTRKTNYGVGDWVTGLPDGIRDFAYSTNMETNPLTYSDLRNSTWVHDIGTVWATILYEATWNLIDKHGKNDAMFPDFDEAGVATDGKFLAMQLVMDGMALQPCDPTFVSARDAILDADRVLTNGSNHCELWTAFAKRGLGAGARSGVHIDNFDMPEGVC
ncbi:Fungalysin metallopeptidase-domain-containing protein [Stachybotrys elegans]|uniref:Extracellular metalloproteinase n=1 Tax=Stachybotrys elegans TaxID=80388 RepID=A0A8K0WKJ2_9HYPO|nr:Fungalysin metallopeptidase-domain-containing protein [Stachybotrys elegans]